MNSYVRWFILLAFKPLAYRFARRFYEENSRDHEHDRGTASDSEQLQIVRQ